MPKNSIYAPVTRMKKPNTSSVQQLPVGLKFFFMCAVNGNLPPPDVPDSSCGRVFDAFFPFPGGIPPGYTVPAAPVPANCVTASRLLCCVTHIFLRSLGLRPMGKSMVPSSCANPPRTSALYLLVKLCSLICSASETCASFVFATSSKPLVSLSIRCTIPAAKHR